MEKTTIIEEIELAYGLEWDYYNEDGSLKEPNYEDVKSNKWRKKYEYAELYGIFKSDKLQSVEMTEREKYIRKLPELNSHDYGILDRCHEKELEYTAIEADGGKDMTYYRNKNDETYTHADDRLRRRNGFDKTKVELEADVKSENLNVEVKTTEEVLKEHEDSISRFISRHLKKED